VKWTASDASAQALGPRRQGTGKVGWGQGGQDTGKVGWGQGGKVQVGLGWKQAQGAMHRLAPPLATPVASHRARSEGRWR